MSVQRWVSYRIDLGRAPVGAPPLLTPISDRLVELISAMPDAQHPDVAWALRFWRRGIRGGYVWLERGRPVCMQWLHTAAENDALHALPAMSAMYPRLDEGVGCVDKLWTFSTVRQLGVATRFTAGMYAVARERGLRELRTHILESDSAAREWATRSGWESYATVERFGFDLPVLRTAAAAVCIHLAGAR